MVIFGDPMSTKKSVVAPGQKDHTDLFATSTWFHIFRDMIDSGDMAKLSGSAIKVYLVIKAHTNFATGKAFPAVETIAEKSGLSAPQVRRELKTLEMFGYLTRSKTGRNNVYVTREKVQVRDQEGRPTAVATWDYLPQGVQDAVADLKNVLVTGDFEGAKIVHIERLQVNVTHLHDQATNFNIQQFMGDMEALPEDLRTRLIKAWSASKTDQSKSYPQAPNSDHP